MSSLLRLDLPRRHGIQLSDINSRYLDRILVKTYEQQAKNFESLLGLEGVGAKTIRALSFIAEIIYGESPSFRDPARFSFAHGGKDGIPYPVNRKVYDASIHFLQETLHKTKVDHSEKGKAFRRLSQLQPKSH